MTVVIMGRSYTSREAMVARVAELDKAAGGRAFSAEERTEWNALNEAVVEAERSIRKERLRDLVADPEWLAAHSEPGGEHYDPMKAQTARPSSPRLAARDRGLATVERVMRAGVLTHEAADRLDSHFRRNDPMALDARYVSAVGNPAYERAFAKLIADPTSGHLRHEPDEVEAMRRVARVEAERAAMVEAAGSTGGFAIPLTLDPSILLTSNGALCPIRTVARVITISTREWTGVSSDGVTASYDAEAEEVSSDEPTLAQPKIETAGGRAFVPFSHELRQDWSGLVNELTTLISDARDVLDATAFLTGTGTDEPEGVLTGLAAPQTVDTAGAGAYAIGDVWKLKAAVADRFKARTTFALHPDTLDKTYQFVAIGDESEAMMMTDRDGSLIGKPVIEWSTTETSIVAGSKIALAGDFGAGFTIADRLGMQVELIPHLFGAGRRPTGQRGLWAMWRTGSSVVNPNALRVLNVKA